jgi:restriction system protein
MSVAAWLLIGIVVIGGAVYVVGAILAGLVGVANSVSEIFSSLVAGSLGRKRLGIRASIPDELREGASPLPKADPDKAVLSSYKPEPFILRIPAAVVFASPSRSIFPDQGEPSDEIDIERIAGILSMTSFRPYEPAFAILTEEPTYPEPVQRRPKDIALPLSWTLWRPVLNDPEFSPPRWGGGLSFLNRLVLDAYKDEFSKVAAAKARKEEMLAICEKRNRTIEDLAGKARKAFERAVADQEKSFLAATEAHSKNSVAYVVAFREEQTRMKGMRDATLRPGGEGLAERIDLAMRSMSLPSFASSEGETKFDEDSGIVIHEHRFPDPSGAEWIKLVELKSGWTKKPANQKEKKEAAARLHPSLCLRLAAEIARLDNEGIVKAVAINGWADYTEKSTGQRKRAYCASLFATQEQILALNLFALDPLEAFSALKGVSARSLELVPIAPIIRLDTNDPRFVDAKEILSKMADGENLAAMDWEDFEHLCRELFERAFANSGAEVKVTQASRDQGVDAVVFDPDPLRGGKIVIQAKRYTNTVDVSAVRDLYGAVINEGAVKGILVTTSHYGPEAYSFAKDKPLTLLNGNELLGLLEKHGYKFRINLAEAKAMF